MIVVANKILLSVHSCWLKMMIQNGECGDWRLSDEEFLGSFRLPPERCGPLAQRNPLPREDRIVFDAAEHAYCVDGVRVPSSVTGLLRMLSAEFDPHSAVAAMMVALSYQSNVFSIFTELREKTNEQYEKVSKRALPLTAFIYMTVGIICSIMFGSKLKSSILLNLGDVKHFDDPTKSFWEAYVCQAAFCILLICHIPFVFFAGKEALLLTFDELHRRSISNALWHKLQSNQYFAQETEAHNAPNPELPIPGDKEG